MLQKISLINQLIDGRWLNYQFDFFAGTFECLNGSRMCCLNSGNVIDRHDDIVDMNASISKCGTTLNYFCNVNGCIGSNVRIICAAGNTKSAAFL